MDFLGFAHTCGPMVDAVTTTAIVRTESSFDPLAIRDNTAKVTISPQSREDAEGIVTERMAAGHRLAIGLMQVTTRWATRLQVNPVVLLDACTNITIGTAILADNYRGCLQLGRTSEEALVCALSAYWSGNGRTGGVYVNKVFKMAGSSLRVAETPGVTDGVLGSASNSPSVPAFKQFHYKSQTFSYSDAPAPSFDFPAGRF